MSGVDHSSRGHALLSASGSSRWMNCTPSARLESRLPDPPDSVYAKEGTFAHELADLSLQFCVSLIQPKVFVSEEIKLKNQIVKDFSKEVLAEMEIEVQKYVDIVLEAYNVAQNNGGPCAIWLEERLDFSDYVPDGFGTGDAMVLDGTTLRVFDLKYGKGVEVSAKENTQLMLYGLGGLKEVEVFYDVKSVEMNIVQPRINNYGSWAIDRSELVTWANLELKPKADQAFSGEGDKCAGGWCKWCKLKPTCKTLADKNMEIAKHDFQDLANLDLSLAELSEIHQKSAMIIDWLGSIKAYLTEQGRQGKAIPGLKVVEGRSTRKWACQATATTKLMQLGFKRHQFEKVSLLGISSVEKLVGRENFKNNFAEDVIKPNGKPTLVLESDKRRPMNESTAAKDFEHLKQ